MTALDTAVRALGLRASKKARTRQAISDTATELFVRHGFENVTVAEIAAAADVSEKTVFNYFPTKEDLFFDRADELLSGLARTIRDRPAGTGVTAALHDLLADNLIPFPGAGWSRLRIPEEYERFHGFVATEDAAPALRARRLRLAESWAEPLADALAEALGLPPGDPRARTYAAMLLAVLALRERTLRAAVLERRSARTVERRVRVAVDEACARLQRAFADVPGA